MKMLLATTLFVGLSAGVFFTWSCSVLPGLKLLGDAEFIRAFQALNRAIQNPVFFLCFFGPALLLPVVTWMQRAHPARCGLLLAAAIVYFVAVLGITIFGNVPMNEGLDRFDAGAATAAEMARERALYEGAWTGLHYWRTVGAVVSFLLTVLACLV